MILEVEVLVQQLLAVAKELVQPRRQLELLVAVVDLPVRALPIEARELKLGDVKVLVELDSDEPGLLAPRLLLLLLRQEVLQAAVADELAPAAAVLLLVRHPSGHTQQSGFFRPLGRRNGL